MSNASRNWTAVRTTGAVGSTQIIVVAGEVEVTRSNQTPRLVRAASPGINPAILLLDVVIDAAGDVGNEVMTWKPVGYEQAQGATPLQSVTVKGAVDATNLTVT